MKIAPQFRAFLDSFHYLNLPKIGRFESISTEATPLTDEIEKRFVRFISDPELKPDAELTRFISKTMKIDASVADSDLYCFCTSVKELLIQGFEAEIPGIGFLHSDSKNQLIFSGKSIYKAVEQKTKRKTAVFLHSSFWL